MITRPGATKPSSIITLMADASVKEVVDTLSLDELPRLFLIDRGGHIRRGIGVIEMDDDPLLVLYRFADGTPSFDRERRGVVVAHVAVEVADDDIAGRDGPAHPPRQDPLDECRHQTASNFLPLSGPKKLTRCASSLRSTVRPFWPIVLTSAKSPLAGLGGEMGGAYPRERLIERGAA